MAEFGAALAGVGAEAGSTKAAPLVSTLSATYVIGELLGAMLGGAVADPRRLQPTLPEPAAAAILKALRPVPEDRHATARAFGGALDVASG